MDEKKETPRSAPDRADFEQWAKTRAWGVSRNGKGVYQDERTQGAWAMRCEMAHGPLGSSVQHPDTALLNFVAEEYLDLQAFEMPTGAGDADVGWKVLQHHMGEPKPREVGIAYRDDPREALREAMKTLDYKLPDAAAMTERERQMLFALQAAWPYVHGWCTIQSARNEVSKALFGRPDNGRAALKVAAEGAGEKAPASPSADWLWVQLMDWCKKRRVHPGEYNDLFEIVGRAREVAAQASSAQPLDERLKALHDAHIGGERRYTELQRKYAHAVHALAKQNAPEGPSAEALEAVFHTIIGPSWAFTEPQRQYAQAIVELALAPEPSLHAQITGHSCCIDVSVEQMLKLLNMDSQEVSASLEKAGAEKGSIEYDAHFGPHVFFDIEEDKDPQPVAAALQELLAEPQAKPASKGFTP